MRRAANLNSAMDDVADIELLGLLRESKARSTSAINSVCCVKPNIRLAQHLPGDTRMALTKMNESILHRNRAEPLGVRARQ